jgi:MerR family mercuric resistance operon transcriptional regulator
MTAANLLTIGRVARAAGVNVETIRYYQRVGLLREPGKPLGGVRRYGKDSIERVRFIKRAQQLGFSLGEVRNLLILNDGVHCRETRAIAAQKLALIETRIVDLQSLRKRLKSLIAACDAGAAGACPILDALLQREHEPSEGDLRAAPVPNRG